MRKRPAVIAGALFGANNLPQIEVSFRAWGIGGWCPQQVEFCCQNSVLAVTAAPEAPLSTVPGTCPVAYGAGLFSGELAGDGKVALVCF